MKYLRWILALFLLSLVVLVFINYPKLTIISGFASKNMASTVFISGRTEASVTLNDHEVPLISLAKAEMATNGRAATASVFGLKQRRAICREGLGCVLITEPATPLQPVLKPQRFRTHIDSLPFPYGTAIAKDTVFPEVDYQQLQKAVEGAFDNPELQRSRTLLISYKNHILTERYVDGFTCDTPILGWSMTKSILATLFGIMEYQGRLDLSKTVGIQDWATDERRNITFDDLLRMQSGLAWEEDYSRISDVTRMLFLEDDMPDVQMEKEPIEPPGQHWNYSSGTSNLLSGILRDHLGEEQDYLNFPYRELIDKIGMHSMLLETDMAGNFVGSSYGWASTRDWAKFGILYLNKGLWQGQRIFDQHWVSYVTQPTADSEGRYGAHFWLNAGDTYTGVPKDLFSANGYQGQYVFIIPSLDLVVVRTGLAEPPDFELNRFLQELVAAFKHPGNGIANHK